MRSVEGMVWEDMEMFPQSLWVIWIACAIFVLLIGVHEALMGGFSGAIILGMSVLHLVLIFFVWRDNANMKSMKEMKVTLQRKIVLEKMLVLLDEHALWCFMVDPFKDVLPFDIVRTNNQCTNHLTQLGLNLEIS